MRDETKAVYNGEFNDKFNSIISPIYLSTVYKYIDEETSTKSDRNITIKYYREENPTLRELERKIALLENTQDSLAFASGMAAISTLGLGLLKKDSKVLLLKEMYGSTLQFFDEIARKFNIKIIKVMPDAESIANALESNNIDLAIIETITNPTLKVIDLTKLENTIKRSNVLFIADNTFASSILLKPAKYGFNIIVHSSTKYISGHNDTMGGILASNKQTIEELWE
ncbi:MAG: hypothetical protein C0201_01160 [Caldisphaera sp.]|nr:MAG: hypothetical protein C0201_01160 [Caldisphaera sp.]